MAQPLEILLFGGFTVQRAGGALPPIPSRAGRALLAYLVLNRDRSHPRGRIATLFWPDLPEARGRRRLSHTLWQIQDALGELAGGVAHLDVRPDALSFDTSATYWLDVEEFETGLATARTALDADRPADVDAALRRAVELYRGDLLAGYFDEWILAEQHRLAQAHLSALGQLVSRRKSAGAYEEALVYARRLTNHDPLREDAHREVMRLCVLLGRPSEALAQYERCRSVLAEELGAEPAESTRRLLARITAQREGGRRTTTVPGDPADDRIAVPLVGRGSERSVLVARLEDALAGHGGVALIEGEAGVGKTRLAAQLGDDAQWRGFTVLWARAAEAGGARAYGPVLDALERALTPVRVEQLAHRLEPVWLQAAAELLPALRRGRGSPLGALDGMQAAQRLRDALAHVVLALGEIAPLLIVAEDLHWADEETLRLLEALGTRVRDRPVLVAATYRGRELRDDEAAWAAVRALDERADPERVQLDVLDREAVGELVSRAAPVLAGVERLVDRVHAETGGNPLFVLETLEALSESATGDPAEQRPALAEELPLASSVEELVATRLGELEEPVRQVLDAAAVVGGPAALSILAGAAGLTPGATADALDHLLRRGLLEEDGDDVVFRHHLVRRAVYRQLADRARWVLHERVGGTLEESGAADVETLAHHFTVGQVPAKAFRYLTAAARAAVAAHAYRIAAGHQRAALEVMERTPVSVEVRADLLAEHESVLDVLGERAEQGAVLERLAALVGGDPDRGRTVAIRRAWLRAHTDRFDEAEQVARTALDAEDDAVRGAALTVIGTARLWSGATTEAEGPLREAVAALAGDDRRRGDARFALGNALRELQRYDEATAEFEAARSAYGSAGDARGEAQAVGAAAAVHAERGEVDRAEAGYRHALELTRSIGYRHGEAVTLINHATLGYLRGRITAALRRFEAARAILAELGNERLEAHALANLASLRQRYLGDRTGASEAAERARSVFAAIGDDRGVAQCLDVLAGVDRAAGRFEDARVRRRRALELLERSPDRWLRVQVMQGLAEVELDAGRPSAALPLCEEALADCTAAGLADLAVPIEAVRALTLLALDEPVEALAATTAAVAALRAGVARGYLVHFAHHRALEAAGRTEDARAAIVAAHGRLSEVLDGVEPAARDRALAGVPEHAAIVAAHAAYEPRRMTMRLARDSAPTGRPLDDHEQVVVTWTVAAPEDDVHGDRITVRRARLVRLVSEAESQGAAPTVEDLALALDVSSATIRRDLVALRQAGHELRTRGTRAS